MHLFMFLQDPLLTERLITDPADVGLVAGMGAFMPPLVAAAVETLIAILAHVGFITGVNTLMLLELVGLFERLLTHGAREWEGSCMNFLMLFK